MKCCDTCFFFEDTKWPMVGNCIWEGNIPDCYHLKELMYKNQGKECQCYVSRERMCPFCGGVGDITDDDAVTCFKCDYTVKKEVWENR